VSFTKKNLSPQNIFFSQSTNDYRSIRCYFAYHNNIPNDIFSATFEMTDKTFGYSKIVLLYNPFKGGITSAIVIGSEDYKEDILVR
jgi:phage terminase large subunit-like protein